MYVDDGQPITFGPLVVIVYDGFMLTKNGFEIIEIFGDYNLSRFDREHSDRLIMKAVKK